jgi:hypothetical protein
MAENPSRDEEATMAAILTAVSGGEKSPLLAVKHYLGIIKELRRSGGFQAPEGDPPTK